MAPGGSAPIGRFFAPSSTLEADENTCRKAFNPCEAVAIGEAIEKAYRPTAESKKTEGRKRGGGDRKSAEANRSRGNSPKAKQAESSRTTAVAAAAVGMDRRTYEKAKEVPQRCAFVDNWQQNKCPQLGTKSTPPRAPGGHHGGKVDSLGDDSGITAHGVG